MAKEKKSHPSLVATIATGIVGGAIVGYLAGSGIEDILHEFSINPPIEYMKTILSGVGALGWSVFGTLQYFNRDEHEGMLVVHVIDGEGSKKPKKSLMKSIIRDLPAIYTMGLQEFYKKVLYKI